MRKLFLLCFLVITRTSSAEVNESLDYTYYTANAHHVRSLIGVLKASSPIRQDGKIFHAHTDWYVKWNYWWFENPDGGCRITKVTIELTGSIKLPRLVNATSKQKKAFDKYVSALRVHELGHYDIGKEAAADIERKMLSLSEMSSCNALESAANDLGNRTLNEYKEKEVQYDVSTSHGKSQGAWLGK